MTILKATLQWTQKNGEKIRVCDMTNEHLRNALRQMRRRIVTQLKFCGPMCWELVRRKVERKF